MSLTISGASKIESDITEEQRKKIYKHIKENDGIIAEDLAKLSLSPGKKAKDVNPYLYGNKVFIRKDEKGTPKWILNPIHVKLINYLKDKYTSGFITTKDLAKNVNCSIKEINPILYSLERKELAVKEAEPDGKKPRWSFKKEVFDL